MLFYASVKQADDTSTYLHIKALTTEVVYRYTIHKYCSYVLMVIHENYAFDEMLAR